MSDKSLGEHASHLGLAELLKQTQKPGVALARGASDGHMAHNASGSQSVEGVSGDGAVIFAQLTVDQIRLNPYQPREHFDGQALKELAQSIKQHGIVQPLVVRRTADQKVYELVAGQRRLEAAKQLALTSVPVCIHNMDDTASMTVALLENIQRQDLNIIEQAQGYARLMDHLQCTHQALADFLGKTRSVVSNGLRLLQLEDAVKALVVEGVLDMGHARCLLGFSGQAQVDLAQKVVAQGLTVRETERLLKVHRGGIDESIKAPGKVVVKDPVPECVTVHQLCKEAFSMAEIKVHSLADGGIRLSLTCKQADQVRALIAALKG
jgi:ParB family transcriptional regulator, chromosome partitioning protein